MLSARYLTLYEFNWLPAMYSHISRLGNWTQYLVAESNRQPLRREPDDRLIHRMSSEMMAMRSDSFAPLSQVPESVWPLAPNQWLQQVAFEMGLAALAGKARSSFDRTSVLELVSVIGSGARKRSLTYLERFPALGASVQPSYPIRSRDHVTALGGQALCEAIDNPTIFGTSEGSVHHDSVVQGVRNRLALRFLESEQKVSFSDAAGIEIRALLAEICEGKLQESNHTADELPTITTEVEQ